MVPTIDEFGGYSSRLRIPEASLNYGSGDQMRDGSPGSRSAKPRNIKAKMQAMPKNHPTNAERSIDND